MHNRYLNILFSAPVNLYFDVTPLGKILNRFSNDLAVMDKSLWMSFTSLIGCIYMILSGLIVASIAVQWMIIVVSVFAILILWQFMYTVNAY